MIGQVELLAWDVLWRSPWLGAIWTAWGACVGSFLNVCIYRIPLGRSLITPRSSCAACGRALMWYENVPILSWLFLLGRCRCKLVKIDLRYFVVEVSMAVLAWILWWQGCDIIEATVWLVFLSFLVVGAGIDWDHMIIPDRITLGGAGLALSFQWIADEGWGSFLGFREALVGAGVGAGILWSIGLAGRWIFSKEAMGLGDVKLMFFIGAMLGWQGVLFVIASSACIGACIGLFLMLGSRGKQYGGRLPYGPFLSLGAILWIIGGRSWWEDYFAFLQHWNILVP